MTLTPSAAAAAGRRVAVCSALAGRSAPRAESREGLCGQTAVAGRLKEAFSLRQSSEPYSQRTEISCLRRSVPIVPAWMWPMVTLGTLSCQSE